MEAQCRGQHRGRAFDPAPGESRMLRSSWTRAPQLLSRALEQSRDRCSPSPEPGSRQKPTATGSHGDRRSAAELKETPSSNAKPSTAPNQ